MPPSPHHSPRLRALITALLLALVLVAVFATGALADAITPESGAGSGNADKIDSLYKLVLVIAAIVFVGVEGALIYSLVKFKARRGRVAAQIRGNTSLEVGWTVGAALILVFLAVFTFIKLPDIKNPPRSGANGLSAGTALYASVNQPDPPGGKALNIEVNGQQYIWRFTYPDGTFAYETMVVPLNTTVTLDIKSQDVAHSWWIPKLGGKFDALPGYTNQTWFKITKPGVYEGQCAELCGRNHANMLARVNAVPVAEYQTWIAQQKRDIDSANTQAAAARKAQSGQTTSQTANGSAP